MINTVDLINTIPSLNPKYTTKESKQNTVAILGSSASSEPLEKYLKASSDITRHFIENCYNVVHGCGSKGIMGEVYKSAQAHSAKDLQGKPIQNLVIVVEPLSLNVGDTKSLNAIILTSPKTGMVKRVELNKKGYRLPL